jgi:hypothetical protein
MRRFIFAAAITFAVTALHSAEAHAQAAITNQTRQALNFYGGHSAINTLSEMPRRTPIQPAATGQLQHNGKPFQATTAAPTVSPYLNLFRDERANTEVVPSYYTYIRPQLEQQAAFQQQQQEIQRLQRQVQGGGQGRAAVAPGTMFPGAGTQARYFDTAQFYGGWQRK